MKRETHSYYRVGLFWAEEETDSGFKSVDRWDRLDDVPSGHYQRSVEGWVILVNGLNPEVMEEDLTDAFSEFGRIKDLRLPLDHQSGYIKGYALILYEHYTEALGAVQQMHGNTFMDMILQCDFVFVKVPKEDAYGYGRRYPRRT